MNVKLHKTANKPFVRMEKTDFKFLNFIFTILNRNLSKIFQQIRHLFKS